MAKQTFTTGQVLTAAQMTSLQQTAMGGGSATAKTASYTLVAADAGTTVIMNSASSTTITVNTALFAAGDTVLIVNQGAGVCTVTAGTATVSTAGSLALSQYETGQLYFLSTSAAIFTEYVQAAAVNSFVGCSVKRAANKTLTTSTATKVDWDSENFDTNSFHDNATNNTRLTVPTGQSGYYLITWNAVFEANTTGYRTSQIKKNNGSPLGTGVITGLTTYSPAQNQLVLNLADGDYIELEVFQNSGTSIRLFCEAEWPNATLLTLMRLGS
jgi:hypothetical protein